MLPDADEQEHLVEYRTLGRSGCAVSALALGTMTFGAETDEAGAHEQLDLFVEAGGTLVDLADVYSAGAAEEITGRWLDVAEARGVTMPQVALAWLVDRPAVTSVILGARTTDQLRDDLGVVDVILDPDDVVRLGAASDPSRADYPHGDVGAEQRSRTPAGF